MIRKKGMSPGFMGTLTMTPNLTGVSLALVLLSFQQAVTAAFSQKTTGPTFKDSRKCQGITFQNVALRSSLTGDIV